MSDDLLLGTGAAQASMMASNGRFKAELDQLSSIALKKPDKMTDRELREVAKNFESLFVRQLLKEMRKSIPQDGFLQYSHASQMYLEMGDDALANQVAEQGGFGLGELVYQQLKETRDNLYSPEEILKKQNEFLSVGGRDGKGNPPEFKPLQRQTDPAAAAMPLPNGHDPIPLPQKKGFMKFAVPIIPLDKIERR